jgi:hypothetical protein
VVGIGSGAGTKKFENPLDMALLIGSATLYLAVILFAPFLVIATGEQSWFWDFCPIITLLPVFVLFKEFALRPKMVIIHQDGVRLLYWTRPPKDVAWNDIKWVDAFRGRLIGPYSDATLEGGVKVKRYFFFAPMSFEIADAIRNEYRSQVGKNPPYPSYLKGKIRKMSCK